MNGDTTLTLQQRGPTAPETTLETLQKTVEDCARRDQWSDVLTFKVNMVLEELATNVMSHGSPDASRTPEMVITISNRPQEVAVRFSDNGNPFNPLEDAPQPPALDPELEDIVIGGIGLHLVKRTMDTLCYSREADTNTISMTIRKH